MRFIIKILQFGLMVCVLVLVYCVIFSSQFSSNQNLTQTLEGSGFYNFAAGAIAQQINAQVVGDQESTEVLKKQIAAGISPQLAKAAVQPLQISLLEWLQSKGSEPALILEAGPIKEKLLSMSDDPSLKFNLTKLIPDQIDLAATDILSPQELNSLKQIKYFYQTANALIMPMLIAVVFASVCLLIVNIRRGSKKVTSFLYPSLAAALLGLIMVGISYLLEPLLKSKEISPSTSDVLGGFTLIVVRQSLPVWITIGIFALSGIIIARIVFRTKDKKLKEKHKK